MAHIKVKVKEDARDCPVCSFYLSRYIYRVRMEQKGIIDVLALWQCPKCKNVELLNAEV